MTVILNPNYNKALDQAISMYAFGHDNKYITLQLAEEGIDDAIIDGVIKEISRIRKAQKRKNGIKLLIYGGSFIIAAIGFSFISTKEGSPILYILWGLAISGVIVMVKGISAILGL